MLSIYDMNASVSGLEFDGAWVQKVGRAVGPGFWSFSASGRGVVFLVNGAESL